MLTLTIAAAEQFVKHLDKLVLVFYDPDIRQHLTGQKRDNVCEGIAPSSPIGHSCASCRFRASL